MREPLRWREIGAMALVVAAALVYAAALVGRLTCNAEGETDETLVARLLGEDA